MTYYKGLIVDNSLIQEYKESELLAYSKYPHDFNNIDILIENTPSDYIYYLRKLISSNINNDNYAVTIDNKEIINYFNKKLQDKNKKIVEKVNKISNYNFSTISIVYKLVYDKEGNLFARELFTKELFPIYNSNCEEFNYYIHYTGYEECRYYLVSVPSIKVSSMLECARFVVGHQVANINEYNKYINKYRGTRLFKIGEKKDIERYKENIIRISHENVFSEDFCIVEENNKSREFIKDIVLKQILETNEKIEKSVLDNIKKDKLKNILIELANNYVESLKIINKKHESVNLNISDESIINLRQEVMKKLVEIEMQLPPEDIISLSNELNILKEKIIKK